jgi:hypothetical protein
MANDPSILFLGISVGLKIVSADTGELVSLLKENGRYEYEVLSGGHFLKEKSGIIRRSRIADGNDRGSVEPGNYVGLLKLELVDKESEETVSKTHVEVCSTKLGYPWLRIPLRSLSVGGAQREWGDIFFHRFGDSDCGKNRRKKFPPLDLNG